MCRCRSAGASWRSIWRNTTASRRAFGFDGVDINAINVCNLSDAGGGAWAHTPPAGRIAIDPVLGRIFFGDAQTEPPRVTFHYGFSADMSGGEYDRAATLSADTTTIERVPAPHATVQGALAPVHTGGVVEITDSGRYVETPALGIDAGARLELRAANEHRPTLLLGGKLEISGGEQSEVTINGLLIAGDGLRVGNTPNNHLRRLRLRHCTLVPGLEPSLIVEIPDVLVEIDHCIVGGMQIADGSQVTITNSIVDAASETGVAFSGIDINRESAGGTLSIENSTIIGKMRMSRIDADLEHHPVCGARSGRYVDRAGALGEETGGLRALQLCSAGLADAAPIPLPARSRDRDAHRCRGERRPTARSARPRSTRSGAG